MTALLSSGSSCVTLLGGRSCVQLVAPQMAQMAERLKAYVRIPPSSSTPTAEMPFWLRRDKGMVLKKCSARCECFRVAVLGSAALL